MTLRSSHRVIALAAALVLTSSAVTGILWAYAPYLYLGDYMRKIAPVPSPAPLEARLGVPEAVGIAETAVGRPLDVTQVVLRPDFGRLLFEVQYRDGTAAGAVLVDAISGERVSPLSEQQAVVIARQYVKATAAAPGVTLEKAYVPRTGRAAPMPAYRVRFAAPGHPELVIHRDSGRVVAHEDDARRWHYVITDLHQLRYAGPVKLAALAGLPLVALVGTGLAMWAGPAWRRRRRAARAALRGAGVTH